MIALGTPKCVRNTIRDVLFKRRGCSSQHTATIQEDCLAIGRNELWRGRLPTSAILAYQNMKRCGTTDGSLSRISIQWSKKVVKAILQQALNLWYFRNKLRHGNDREEEAAIRRRKALKRCKALDSRVRRLSRDKDIFVSNETTQKWTTGMIVNYLTWAEPLATKMAKEPNCEPRPEIKWDVTSGEVYDPP